MLVWYILRTYNKNRFGLIISEDKVKNKFFTKDSCHILRLKFPDRQDRFKIPLFFSCLFSLKSWEYSED